MHYIEYDVWDEITYPFPNFNRVTVEVWLWINNLIPHMMMDVILIMHAGIEHDDVIKWNHFPRYWPFVRGIHRYPVNSPHKSQWRGALIFSLISALIKGWVNNGDAGDLGSYRAHYDVIVMSQSNLVNGEPRWRYILPSNVSAMIEKRKMCMKVLSYNQIRLV